METPGANHPISAPEAAASLAVVKDSWRRARRVGYPVWFWLTTGLGLGAVPLYIGKPWLPSPWMPVISLASVVLLAASGIGVCLRIPHVVRDCRPVLADSLREVSLFLWPFVPYAAVLLAGGIAWEKGYWNAPLAPLATAAAAFAVWTGLGLAATTFSSRLSARR